MLARALGHAELVTEPRRSAVEVPSVQAKSRTKTQKVETNLK